MLTVDCYDILFLFVVCLVYSGVDKLFFMAERTPSSRLTREQKTGFVLLLTFGIVAVGMGALQMRNNIYGLFAFESGTAA